MTGSSRETQRRPAKESGRPCRVFVHLGPPRQKTDAGPPLLAHTPLITGPALSVDPPVDWTIPDDPMPNYEDPWDSVLNTFPDDFAETALGHFMP
jgi:hypothetical protein